MAVKINIADEIMTAYLIGEIDHHSARDIRQEIDDSAQRARIKMLYLDFKDITFMDSSGIGLVMGRYNLMQGLGGEVRVTNVPGHIKKVMRLAGLDRLAVLETNSAASEQGRGK